MCFTVHQEYPIAITLIVLVCGKETSVVFRFSCSDFFSFFFRDKSDGEPSSRIPLL